MRIKLLLLLFLFILKANAQSDEEILQKIYAGSLTKGMSYQWLDHLSNEIGGRLSGSKGASEAVEYTKAELERVGLDKVWLQPVMVPHWIRGDKETGYFLTNGKRHDLNICALGGSVATPEQGTIGNVIEVHGIQEMKDLGTDKIKGKIVFFNRPMEPTLIHTFQAYGGCVDQRYSGAMEAGKLGAKGVIVRSMTLRLDNYPHTGAMTYGDLPVDKRVPSAAISTMDAEALSEALKLDPDLTINFRQSCEQLEDTESFNVIGEIRGSEFPNEIIIVGGHLDSWDLGDGSHDDGAGVVQSMEVLRLLKQTGIRPKRTIRVVLFMNEENGLRGGKKYAEVANSKNEHHIMALESDSGGFTPRGFSFDCSEEEFEQIRKWEPLFKPYLIHYFEKGGSGADIGPLKREGMVLAGLRPDSQRYFDHHHTSIDTFDAVNKRELELGAATMTSLIYLYDKYGLKNQLQLPIKN
ncbi:MAG: M20/M25/M40 family metallo-hydrolase [Flavobacteriaceae bacterium]|nr:MAG: M20/M25/M40 family metallo-hydrolase [Flavobacteriaceae bacterium]